MKKRMKVLRAILAKNYTNNTDNIVSGGSFMTTSYIGVRTIISNIKMKNHILVSTILLLLSTNFYAQSPGGISSNLELWVKANENSYNTGNTQATNGQTVTQWKDNSPASNDFDQTDNSQKPIYRTAGLGAVNFNPTLEFLGIGAGNETQLINSTLNLDNNATLFGVWFFQNQATTGSMHKTILVSDDYHGGGGTSAGGYLFGTGRSNSWTLTNSTPGTPATGTSYNNATQINNNYHIGELYDASGVSNLYFDGILQSSASHATNQTVFTSGYEIGAHENANAANQTSRYYKGYLAEVIAFDVALTATERRKVESYLAIKYGITLTTNPCSVDYLSSAGTIIWDQSNNAGYDNDIAGIALDNTSALNQPKSHSINKSGGILNDIVTIANGTNFGSPLSLMDQSFMTWGHNNESINCASTDVGISSSGENIGERTERVWKVQESGTVNTTTLEFDMSNSNLGNWGDSNYRLLVDADGVFNAGVTSISPSFVDVANNKLYFEYDFNGTSGFFYSVGIEHTAITFTGSTNICLGDNTYIIVDFINSSGITDVTYNDGISNITVNNVANGDSILVSPSITTSFTVVNGANTACFNYPTSTATITVNPNPVLTLGEDTIICNGQINIGPVDTFNIYHWLETGSTNSTIETSTPGLYTLTVYNSQGCADTDDIEVFQECPFSLLVPNVFTPNDDDFNDTFRVTGEGIEDFELIVFNRWGKLIFETTSIENGWNGRTSSGSIMTDGSYAFIINFSYYEKQVLKNDSRKGFISLLK